MSGCVSGKRLCQVVSVVKGCVRLCQWLKVVSGCVSGKRLCQVVSVVKGCVSV